MTKPADSYRSKVLKSPTSAIPFGWVTPRQLRDSTYSSNPIEGSLTGIGQISPGSIIALRSGPVYAKIRINGLSDTHDLGVSWVSYLD